MSNKFTNTGLVGHCEKALKERWYYGWGAFGQKATEALVTRLVSQYTNENTRWRSYMMQAVAKGTRLCDCYGLIKSYFWWTDDESNPQYNSNGFIDTNTAGAYNRAVEKGTLATLPEIPGIILYMPGHVGVYCGSGRFIELMGNGNGAVEGKIVDGRITKGSKFTHWFKDRYIEYIKKEQEEAEMRYNTIGEIKAANIAVDAIDAIEAAINKGKEVNKNNLNLVGGVFADMNNLNLTRDMIVSIVFNYRSGLYD